MGALNRDSSADDWGKFDITTCEQGDDRKNFLRKDSHSYLLYWWHVLEREQLLNFTCVKLPTNLTSNTSNFPLVSRARSPIKKGIPQSDTKKETAKHFQLIGNGVNNLAKITVEREIEVWQEKQFDLELTLIKVDSDEVKKIELIKKRISNLNDKITKIKRSRLDE